MNSVEKKVHELDQVVKALTKRVTDLEAANAVVTVDAPVEVADPPPSKKTTTK